MTHRWYEGPILTLVLGLAACGGAQENAAPAPWFMPSATPREVGLSPEHLVSIGALLEANVRTGQIAGGVVGVARGGRLAYLASAGAQDIASGVDMSTTSVFRMYSMTKPVVAVAAMMLHERDAFELDDPVATYLPEFADVVVLEDDGTTRAPTRPVTVRDLFLHTAGLSHRSSSEYREAAVRSRAIDLPQFIRNITGVPLRSDPGAAFRYSASPTVLGRLVEVWSGVTLDVFLDEFIFEPIGMVDTGFQVRPDQRGRFTTVYRHGSSGRLEPFEIEEVPFTERPALLEGSVGLVGTVPDFMLFSQMLLNGGALDERRLLTAESVTFLTSNAMPEELLPIYGAGHGWGAASVSVVMDTTAAGGNVFEGEYRWDGSAGTEFWVDPGSGTVLVTAWQNDPANPGRLRQQIRQIVRDAIRTGDRAR